jgi:hypothetical protein
MNERIKELALQAGAQGIVNRDFIDVEKFAQLIIREYAQEYQKLVDGHSVVLPKNREHAENMVRVGMFYLENNR